MPWQDFPDVRGRRIGGHADTGRRRARLRVNATARLDLHDAGIRVPGFMVRRFVDVTISCQLTQEP